MKYHCLSCQSLDSANNLGKFEKLTKTAMKYEDATAKTEGPGERFLEHDTISMSNQLKSDEAKIEPIERQQNEILINFFEFLDTKSILNAALVCKRWVELIVIEGIFQLRFTLLRWNEIIGTSTAIMRKLKFYVHHGVDLNIFRSKVRSMCIIDKGRLNRSIASWPNEDIAK